MYTYIRCCYSVYIRIFMKVSCNVSFRGFLGHKAGQEVPGNFSDSMVLRKE